MLLWTVRGIVVSHHHGIMDYSAPPLFVLPDIVKAVGAQMTIIVDCCIESGMDVFKALALGADAVCVGQNLIPALTSDGADGVKQRICELTRQLRGVMSRTGARTLDEIDGTVLHLRNF